MAVDTVYENQDTVSPRLNKQYTTVVNLGTVTVWYDRLKERLSEHADHIKTLKKTSLQTKPVNHCQWKTAASLCTQCQGNFFSVCNQEIPIR